MLAFQRRYKYHGPEVTVPNTFSDIRNNQVLVKRQMLGLIPDPLNWNIHRDAREHGSDNSPGDFWIVGILPWPSTLGEDSLALERRAWESLGQMSGPMCAEILVVEKEERTGHIDNSYFLFFDGLIFFPGAFAKSLFHSCTVERAQNLALSPFVEISSLVPVQPPGPRANKLLLIVGLGKALKIEQGSSMCSQGGINRGKQSGGVSSHR